MDHIYLATNEHLRASVVVETRNARFIKECQARYPLHRYERLAPLMHRLRILKDPEEIRMLQKACDITEAGFRRLLGFIKPGVGEWEIEAELLHEFVRRGSRGFAYAPIIGSGKNACVLHYVENDQVCQDGEMVLLDVAAEYAGWNSDLTRTVPVNGKFTKRQREVYDAVLRVFRGANEILRPGNNPVGLSEAGDRDHGTRIGRPGTLHRAGSEGPRTGQTAAQKIFHARHLASAGARRARREPAARTVCRRHGLHHRTGNLHPRGKPRRPHRKRRGHRQGQEFRPDGQHPDRSRRNRSADAAREADGTFKLMDFAATIIAP